MDSPNSLSSEGRAWMFFLIVTWYFDGYLCLGLGLMFLGAVK